jgi:hypothetical protein
VALRTTVGAITLLASDAAILADALGADPPIDWTFVAQHLAWQHLQTDRTGLLGIDEILGGECLRRGPGGNWNKFALWVPCVELQ